MFSEDESDDIYPKILFVSKDSIIQWWEVGKPDDDEPFKQMSFRMAPKDSVTFVGFSNYTRWMLSTTSSNTAELWNIANSRVDHRINSRIFKAKFSPNDRLLLSTANDKCAHLWNLTLSYPETDLQFLINYFDQKLRLLTVPEKDFFLVH